MGQFAAAIPYVLGAVTAAAGVYSAKQSYEAGKEQAAQYKQQELQEGDAARQREIQRRRGLLRALASQNASAGAAGLNLEGSLQNIVKNDIEEAASDILVERAGAALRGRVLRSSASEASKAGAARATSSLVDTANSTYQTWPSSTKKKALG